VANVAANKEVNVDISPIKHTKNTAL